MGKNSKPASETEKILKALDNDSASPRFTLVQADNIFIDDLISQLLNKDLIDENNLLVVTALSGSTAAGNELRPDLDVKAPLVVAWPGHLPQGKVITGQCRMVDILPTIIDYMALPFPPQAQGVSLRPLINIKSGLDISAVTESLAAGAKLSQSLRSEGWLYFKTDGRAGLFSLMTDPRAKNNLLSPAIMSRLSPVKLKQVQLADQNLKAGLDSFNAMNARHFKKISWAF